MCLSTISLRIPKYLHEKVRELARKEKLSINQLITLALAEKLSAIATEEYLGQRAARGDRVKDDQALAKVPDREPEEQDMLP